MNHLAQSQLFDEAKIRRSLAKVVNANGVAIGTAFFISDERLLTCYHVISPLVNSGNSNNTIRVILSNGKDLMATLDQFNSAPELDVAVLFLGKNDIPALPCGLGGNPGQPIWTSGFQKTDNEIQSDAPTTGRLGGRVNVKFPGPPVNVISCFEIENATIRPGLSGAPLVDRETGVVIGIVDAEHFRHGQIYANSIMIEGGSLDGYAIALDKVSTDHALLAALILDNRQSIPAFGNYLNDPGAHVLCQLQVNKSIRELINTGRFDRERYVVRETISDQINIFLSSNKKMLPIVGHTGVGKTTLLGHMAEHLREARQMVLFIRGFHIKLATSASIADDLSREVKASGASGFRGLKTLLAAAPSNYLIVLVDALNEITFASVSELQSWWSQTVDWIAETNVRIIVTSRLKTWDILKTDVRSDLFFSPSDQFVDVPSRKFIDGSSGLFLGDFTTKEYEEARKLYGLAGAVFQTEIMRHPFFMRMWRSIRQQLADGGMSDNLTIYTLLEQYSHAVSQRASSALLSPGQAVVTTKEIKRVLSILGDIALRNGINTISSNDLDAIISCKPGLLSALEEQHILEEDDHNDNYRFAFDSLAEYLMSQHISPSSLTDGQIKTLLNYGRDSQGSAVGLALIRAEHQGDESTVSLVLSRITLAECMTDLKLSCLALLLVSFKNGSRYFSHLDEIIKNRQGSYEWSVQTVDAVSQLIHSGCVPVGPAVNLFRMAFVHEDRYVYEWGHWQGRWSTEEFEREVYLGMWSNPSNAVLRAIDSYPAETMAVLIGWLDDNTSIGDVGGVSIADAAAALLYHRRLKIFSELCQALAEKFTDIAIKLLDCIFQAEPAKSVEVLDKWSVIDTSRYDYLVIMLGQTLVRINAAIADEAGLGIPLDRLWARFRSSGAPQDKIFITLVATLSEFPSRSNQIFPLIQESILKRKELFTPNLLLPYSSTRWDEVLAVLDNCISDRTGPILGQVANVLSSSRITADRRVDSMERLDTLVAKADPSNIYEIALAVEFSLGIICTGEPARAKILEIAKRCLNEFPPNCRQCILYYATSDRAAAVDTRAEMDGLVLESLTHEDDENCQRLLIQKLTRRSDTFASLLKELQPLTQRMNQSRFEEIIIKELRFKFNLPLDYFSQWIKETVKLSLGLILETLYTGISSGKTGEKAVEDLYQNL